MEYIDSCETVAAQTKRILCCECGTTIEPNAANMCVGCLRSHVDITEGIPKQTVLHFCRGCERYLNPPAEWVQCALESRELLALCLKKLKGLSQVKLIDAGFVWTEPHSKRIKVKLTVHAEVLGGAVLQQVFVVEYVVNHQMCSACHRSEAQDFWRALVQVRQKAENKKTFYYLEQLILKHKAHENTLGIKPIHDGLDFYYSTEAHARKMVDFLVGVLPCRYQQSKKLISHDIHSNTYNYKFTFCVEIVPVSRESLVCLPRRLAQQLAGISQLCLVQRATSALHLIDPRTSQTAELSGAVYWRQPFRSVCDPRQLVEYVVMELEPVLGAERRTFPGQGGVSARHVLADVWLVRASELGLSVASTHVRTHLGHVLKIGDSVLGYNLQDSNINDTHYNALDGAAVPDVVLVKKHYGSRRRHRNWKLKRLAEADGAFDPAARDFHDFLDDLEEDPSMRQNVNIFKSGAQIPVDSSEDSDPSRPCITLEEMLDDLQIDDVEMT